MLATAIMVMFATYLFGREDLVSRRSIVEQWAARKTQNNSARMILAGVLAVALSHLVYLPTMLPFWITCAAGMQTERVRSAQLFPGYDLPHQPVTVATHPEWGTPIMFAVLIASTAAIYFCVWRWDLAGRTLRSGQAQVPATDPPRAP